MGHLERRKDFKDLFVSVFWRKKTDERGTGGLTELGFFFFWGKSSRETRVHFGNTFS